MFVHFRHLPVDRCLLLRPDPFIEDHIEVVDDDI
jgi:hypothetical protein